MKFVFVCPLYSLILKIKHISCAFLKPLHKSFMSVHTRANPALLSVWLLPSTVLLLKICVAFVDLAPLQAGRGQMLAEVNLVLKMSVDFVLLKVMD